MILKGIQIFLQINSQKAPYTPFLLTHSLCLYCCTLPVFHIIYHYNSISAATRLFDMKTTNCCSAITASTERVLVNRAPLKGEQNNNSAKRTIESSIEILSSRPTADKQSVCSSVQRTRRRRRKKCRECRIIPPDRSIEGSAIIIAI